MRAAALLVLIAAPAAAAPPPIEVVRAAFFVDLVTPDGDERHLATTRVPAVPEDVCYHWQLRVKPRPGIVAIRERLVLPAAALEWGLDEDSPSLVAKDRRSADTDFIAGLGQGLITHGWCVAEGDPLGTYVIEVSAAGRMLHRFRYTVVSPPREH